MACQANTVWSMTRLPNGQFWVATDQGSVALGSRPARIARQRLCPRCKPVPDSCGWHPSAARCCGLKPQGQIVERMTFAPTVLMAVVDSQNQLWLETREGVFLIQDADAAIADIRPKLMLPYGKMNIVTDPLRRHLGHRPVRRLQARAGRRLPPRCRAGSFCHSTARVGFYSGRHNLAWHKGHRHSTLPHDPAARCSHCPGIRAPTISSDSILFHPPRPARIGSGSAPVKASTCSTATPGAASTAVKARSATIWIRESVYEDVDGSMWFGTSHGLSHLLVPDQAPSQTRLAPWLDLGRARRGAPLPLSSSITAKWSAAPADHPVWPDFDYAQGAITFRYRLRGLDESWTGNGCSRGSLRPTCRSVSSASNSSLSSRTKGISSAAIGFTVRIDAPWWRQWWFFGLCAGCLVLCFIGAWQGPCSAAFATASAALEETVNLRTAEIEQARRQARRPAPLLEQGRLHEEQRRLEEMVEARTGGDRAGAQRPAAHRYAGRPDQPAEPPCDHERAGRRRRAGPPLRPAARRVSLRHRPLQEDQRPASAISPAMRCCASSAAGLDASSSSPRSPVATAARSSSSSCRARRTRSGAAPSTSIRP